MNEAVIVGCPIRGRDWIIGEWFHHVEVAAKAAGVIPAYVFAANPDDSTWHLVSRLCFEARRGLELVQVDGDESGPVDRNWGVVPGRLEHMVKLRNALLKAVRRLSPPMFLSLDSDVLIHEDLIGNLVESLLQHDYRAVGGKMYIHEHGTDFPSWAQYVYSGGLRRVDADGVFPVDIIMGIKLMSPDAYAVNYVHHPQGEDVGWSLACKTAGVRLGWDGRVANKHVMTEGQLGVVDSRIGW